MDKINEVIKKLNEINFDSLLLNSLEEIVDELRLNTDGKEAITPVFLFIENHPNEDLGSPGPLVHWLESFYKNGYEERLLESIKRKPTPLSIWMLNRLINANNSNQNYYKKIMEQIANDKSLSPTIVELALSFLA